MFHCTPSVSVFCATISWWIKDLYYDLYVDHDIIHYSLWGRTVWIKLCGENLSHYSKKIESLGFWKNVRIITILLSDATITNISQSLPHIIAEKTACYEEIRSLSPYL